jgi:hypothetical protein
MSFSRMSLAERLSVGFGLILAVMANVTQQAALSVGDGSRRGTVEQGSLRCQDDFTGRMPRN